MKFFHPHFHQLLISLLAITNPLLASATLEGEMPSFQTTTLNKVEFQVPEDLPETPVVLIIGFTKDSQNQCAEWSNNLRNLSPQNGVSVYDIPVIEGAPGFVRGLIMRSMRKQTSESLHSSYLMLMKGSAPLKAWIGYDDSDDAFVLLLNQEHQPVWIEQGIYDTSKMERLSNAVINT